MKFYIPLSTYIKTINYHKVTATSTELFKVLVLTKYYNTIQFWKVLESKLDFIKEIVFVGTFWSSKTLALALRGDLWKYYQPSAN